MIGLSRYITAISSGLKQTWFRGDDMPPTAAEWPWPHFSRAEMTCKCGCGCADMDPDFMDLLERLRFECGGLPMTINSGYRCPDHNKAESNTGTTGPHTTGKAVDIAADPERQQEIMAVAKKLGFTGFGVGGRKKNILHVDTLGFRDGFPMRPNSWSY